MVYAGTRQVYGRPDRLPVDETHLVRPADINGVNKAAGEYYHLLYNNVFGVRACSLRLTNVYGPRQLIRHNRQGFIGWFIRLAIEGEEIQVFGDGSQLRDFVFVDDAADAFMRAGATDRCDGEVFNVGGDEPVSHQDLVALLLDVAGSGSRPLRGVARGEEAHRHRQLLHRFDRSSGVPSAGRRSVDLRTGLRAHASRSIARTCASISPTRRTSRASPGDQVSRADAARGCGARVKEAIARVVERGWFILGPELDAFEREFAAASGVRHAVGVDTGTDALAIALRALGIGPGDEVITSPLSAAYSGLAIMMAGARPVFADIDPERLTLDPRAAAAAITAKTAAIMPVHLYGQAADMAELIAGGRPAQPRGRRGLLPGAPRHVRRSSGGLVRRRPARSASTPPRISARSATPARS